MRDSTNWKLTLAYDGAEFHGWQLQPGKPTIQGVLADAVTSVTGQRVLPQGSGRTDAGVHAWGQVASFPLAAAIPAENLRRALNRILPAAIRILSAEQAPAEFHARHSAVGKVYQYRIFHGRVCSPFLARYVTCCRWPLDLAAMQRAAEAILGQHDFTSFAASDPDRAARVAAEPSSTNAYRCDVAEAGEWYERKPTCSNLRCIEQSEWRQEIPSSSFPDALSAIPAEGNTEPSTDPFTNEVTDRAAEIFTYTVRGNGFLHHMVRNLVGTFLEIGRGRVPAADMPGILAGRDRSLAGPTAPANGLCLMKVFY